MLSIRSIEPAAGSQGVPSNAPITVTFNEALASRSPDAPADARHRRHVGAHRPDHPHLPARAPLIPSSEEVVTVPGRCRRGAAAPGRHPGRHAHLLLHRRPRRHAAPAADAGRAGLPPGHLHAERARSGTGRPGHGPAGYVHWRWTTLPPELTSQWTQGAEDEITRAAVISFENQNGLGVDGIAGPAVWTALIDDTINSKSSAVALRVRPGEQGPARDADPLGQRSRPVQRYPGEHRCSRRRHGRRHLLRVRARAFLRDEGHQPRRQQVRRSQRALRQLLQRWATRCTDSSAPPTDRHRATVASR